MVCGNITAGEVCGWSELLSGNLVNAVYVMYDAALLGWFIAILFFLFQAGLYMKTRNPNIVWITGVLFLSLFIRQNYIALTSLSFMALILLLELAGIMYFVIYKKLEKEKIVFLRVTRIYMKSLIYYISLLKLY